jgi:hypothetical protein
MLAAIAALVSGSWLGFKKRNYIYYSAWFTVFLASLLLSKKLITINRGILFSFPLLVLPTALLVVFGISIIRSKTGRAIFGSLLVVLIVAYGAYDLRTAIRRDYGAKINPNFAPFDGFTFYHDNKTPIQYVNRHWRSGDQIIVFGLPTFFVPYSRLRPDWRVWTGSSITYKEKNIFTDTPEVDDLGKLDRLLRGERTWVVTSYSIQQTERIGHIDPNLVGYLETYSGQCRYTSKDKTAKVYMINRRPKTRPRRH